MKKKLVILLSISLLTCSCGLAGCAAQKENKTEVSVTNLDVSQSTETADNTSEPDKKSNLDSSNSKESIAVSSTVEESGKDTASSVAESAEPSQSTPPETSQPSDISVPEASHSSQETPKGTLTASPEVRKKFGKTYWFDSAETNVSYEYPGITQEQFDEIVSLRCIHYGNKLLYKEGIIVGTVDPSSPRLTLVKVKEIINNAKSLELESDIDVYKTHKTSCRDYPDCYGGYIFSEINKIQPPDWIQSEAPGAWYYSFSDEKEEGSTEGIKIDGRINSLAVEYYRKVDHGDVFILYNSVDVP